MPRARYPGQTVPLYLNRVNRKWTNKHHAAMFNRKHGRTWYPAKMAKRTSTRIYRRYKRRNTNTSRRTATRSLGRMRVGRSIAPPQSQTYARGIMRSKEDILLSGNAVTTTRATLRYVMSTAKVSDHEWQQIRRQALEYHYVRYTGTTVVVQYTGSMLNVTEDTLKTNTWNNTECNFMINLDYKHSDTDLVNPSWPMNMKDTVKIRKGQSASKTFRIAKVFGAGYWAARDNVIPASKPASQDPKNWVQAQASGVAADRPEVNVAVLITIDGIPHLTITTPGVGQQWDTQIQVKCYHHFLFKDKVLV